MPLEQGYGPVNFETTQVDLCDGLNELSEFAVGLIKGERVFLAICFLALLCFTIYTVYAYLWKGRIYKSYPLIFSYILLALFSMIGVFYELFMGFRCGKQDCFTLKGRELFVPRSTRLP